MAKTRVVRAPSKILWTLRYRKEKEKKKPTKKKAKKRKTKVRGSKKQRAYVRRL